MRVRVSASAIQVCGETRNSPATFQQLARRTAPTAGWEILPELKQTLVFRFLPALCDNLTFVIGYLTTLSVSIPEVLKSALLALLHLVQEETGALTVVRVRS
jgi:hypothetical protein